MAPGAPVMGEGHIHYYLDIDIPTEPGKPAVSAPGTYKPSTETSTVWSNVAPGSHTLGVQLVQGDHTPLVPPVTAKITVNVTAAAVATPVVSAVPTTAQTAAPSLTPTPTPAPGTSAPAPAKSSTPNWVLIAIIGAVVVVLVVVVSVVARRKK